MKREEKRIPRLLIIEDDSTMTLLLKRMLKMLGYETAQAESPDAAIRIASEFAFDLALMDVDLNDKTDGVAVADILRRRFDLPSIYMTAYADDALLDRARQTRPYGYLVKPVKRLELRATIEMALSRLELDRRVNASEEFYRSMFEYNEAVKLLIDPVTADIVDANPAACAYYGYSLNNMKRMKITDINLLTAETTKRQMELTRIGRKKRHEFRHRLAGGEIRAVDVYSGPVELGGRTLLLSIIHDITEQKQARRELAAALAISERHSRETEALLAATRSVLENHDFQQTARQIFDICSATIGSTAGYVAMLSPDSAENEVLFLESGGRSCSVNPELPMPIRGLRERAYSLGETVYDNDFAGSRWMEYMPSGHVHLENVMFAPLKKGEKVVGIMGLANKPAPFTEADARLASGFGEFASVALLNSEILESLEKAKETAEAAAQVKSTFLANMSHELRTPLNGILGYAQILQKDPSLDERQLRAAETIRKSGEHLLTLINDILDISRIEAGKIELHPTAVFLKGFLEGICSIIGVKAREKGLDFRFQAEGELPRGVMADEVRLRQILINLLGNAVKFTPEGRVVLKVQEAGERLRFEVADTGIGISADKLAQLFIPFRQVHEAGYRTEGTGLGLSISRQLARLMGGELKVESEPGRGSRFIFDVRLPRISHAAVPEKRRSDRITGYAGTRKRVLIVDDVADNRHLLRDLLAPVGFETVEAAEGREALEKLGDPDHPGEERPDLILMDLVMPRMGGDEAIGCIRKRRDGKDFFIIAVSADAAREQRSSENPGYDVFLKKPLDADALFEAIGRGLGLEWIRAQEDSAWENSSLPFTGDDSTGADIIPPPRSDLEKLHGMARIGAIGDIRKMAKKGKSDGDDALKFWETIESLSMVFNLPEIKDLIQRYREAG